MARAQSEAGALEEAAQALGRGQVAEAEAPCRAGLTPIPPAPELSPRAPRAHFKLGVALERQRRWPEAEAAYAEAARLKPGHGIAHLRQALMCRRQARTHDEEAALRRAVACVP